MTRTIETQALEYSEPLTGDVFAGCRQWAIRIEGAWPKPLTRGSKKAAKRLPNFDSTIESAISTHLPDADPVHIAEVVLQQGVCPVHELRTSGGDTLAYGVLPEFVRHIEACQPEWDVIRSANGHIFWVDSEQKVLALCMGLVRRK